MVVEGKTPAVTTDIHEYPDVKRRLEAAGYRPRIVPGFKKEGEIETYVRDRPDLGNRWIHVQVVRSGNRVEVYAHTEPSAEGDPLGHAAGVVTGDANYGAGARILRGDLRAAKRLMNSPCYAEAQGRGERVGTGSCSICGNAIWSAESLARGIGSWCFRNRRT